MPLPIHPYTNIQRLVIEALFFFRELQHQVLHGFDPCFNTVGTRSSGLQKLCITAIVWLT